MQLLFLIQYIDRMKYIYMSQQVKSTIDFYYVIQDIGFWMLKKEA